MEALLAAHHRGAHHHARAVVGEQGVHDLRGRGGADRLAAGAALLVSVPARGRAAAREEEAQVVVDLRGGGHGGAGRVAAAALLDGDGGRQALDRLDVGLLHLVEELARVRGEALHVLALPLGEDGVEGQRALAAARDAGHHHQAVARDGQVHRLQVVLARAADADAAEVGGGLLCACHGRSANIGLRPRYGVPVMWDRGRLTELCVPNPVDAE